MASDLKDLTSKLAARDYSPADRDQLLARVASTEGLRAKDVLWLLFRPDRAAREAAIKALQRAQDPQALDLLITETRGKPDAAVRAAVMAIPSLNIPNLETRLAQLIAPQAKESKESREMRDFAQRVFLELPLTKTTEPLLWQLEAAAATAEERAQIVAKLATGAYDERAASRWHKLATDGSDAIRTRALEFLAQKASPMPVGLLVDQLPNAGYATQQVLIEALAKAPNTGPEFIDQMLPLVASGEASTRTAALKILVGLNRPKDVIRKFIRFTKTLAPFVRQRALESLNAFGDDRIEPVIELLGDPDEDVRGAAIAVASTFNDPRVVPATIDLLRDPDWWIRIAAADALGTIKDPRAVEPLIAALADPDLKWSAVEALGRIGDPRALSALGRMLGDPLPDVRIEVMQAIRNYTHPQVQQALLHVAANDPERVVRARAVDILDSMSQQADQVDAVRSQALAIRPAAGQRRLDTLLIATRNQGASDFHLAVGQPPVLRMAAELVRMQGEPYTAEQTEVMIREVLSPQQLETLTTTHQLDFCLYIPQGGRYRGNIFRDHRGYSAVFRVIPDKPPTMSEIGLPAHLAEIADYHQGLVLVCGPSGSGKSTTLAALVNLFNETRSDHVLTMEDPVEFVHPFKNCLINQREVGTHTVSFARALRAALREDPDVVVIGELRDNESVSLALTAAETGHIVLGTINATSAPKAIDRIISSFPSDEQPQIRASLSESLKYVIAQRLLPSKKRHGQVAAFEILKGTSTVSNLIRDEKTYQIHSAMQIGKSQGMQTFDEGLRDLLKRELITGETAYRAASKKDDFEAYLPARPQQS